MPGDYTVTIPVGNRSITATFDAAPTDDDILDATINGVAQMHGVDPVLFRSLVQQESGFNPKAKSKVGAYGLTQLMPETAKSLGVDPTDTVQNLDGGARYFAKQLQTFGGDTSKALAAYNAGPGAVMKHGGVPPYAETQNYVKAITANALNNGWQPKQYGALVSVGRDQVSNEADNPGIFGTGQLQQLSTPFDNALNPDYSSNALQSPQPTSFTGQIDDLNRPGRQMDLPVTAWNPNSGSNDDAEDMRMRGPMGWRSGTAEKLWNSGLAKVIGAPVVAAGALANATSPALAQSTAMAVSGKLDPNQLTNDDFTAGAKLTGTGVLIAALAAGTGGADVPVLSSAASRYFGAQLYTQLANAVGNSVYEGSTNPLSNFASGLINSPIESAKALSSGSRLNPQDFADHLLNVIGIADMVHGAIENVKASGDLTPKQVSKLNEFDGLISKAQETYDARQALLQQQGITNGKENIQLQQASEPISQPAGGNESQGASLYDRGQEIRQTGNGEQSQAGQGQVNGPPGNQLTTTDEAPPSAGFFYDRKLIQAKNAVNGQPAIIETAYHGSPDLRYTLNGEWSKPGDNYKGAIFFSDDPSIAKTYADDKRAFDYQNAEPGVIKRYLTLDNPKVIDANNESWKNTRAEVEKAQSEGYDGIIIKRVKDAYNSLDNPKGYNKPATNIVVFDKSQIHEKIPTNEETQTSIQGNQKGPNDGQENGDQGRFQARQENGPQALTPSEDGFTAIANRALAAYSKSGVLSEEVVGKGNTAAELEARYKAGADQALANPKYVDQILDRVNNGGHGFTPEEVGAVSQVASNLSQARRTAYQTLESLEESGAPKAQIDEARAALGAAQDALDDHMQRMQVGKTELSNSFRSLQLGQTDYGQVGSILDKYEKKTGKVVDSKTEAYLKGKSDAYAEIEKTQIRAQELADKQGTTFKEALNNLKQNDAASAKAVSVSEANLRMARRTADIKALKDAQSDISKKILEASAKLSSNPFTDPELLKLGAEWIKNQVVITGKTIANAIDGLRAAHPGVFDNASDQELRDAVTGFKAIDRKTKQLNTDIDSLNKTGKLPEKAPAKTAWSPEISALVNEKNRIKADIERKISNDTPQTIKQKALGYSRAAILSNPATFLKLAGNVILNQPVRVAENLVKPAFNKVKFGSSTLGDTSLTEGVNSLESFKKDATPSYLTKRGLTAAGEVLKTGVNEADRAAGKLPDQSDGFMSLPGRAHAAVKSFAQMPAYDAALSRAVQKAAAKGMDINNPKIAEKLMMAAAVESKAAKLMESNKLVDALQQAVEKGIKSPDSRISIPSAIFRYFMPIVKVPANYLRAVSDYAGGGFVRGATILRDVNSGRIDASPELANEVYRAFARASVGGVGMGITAAALVAGFNYKNWLPDSKENPQAFGVTLPQKFLHSPALAAFRLGVEAYNNYTQKHDVTGAVTGPAATLASETPGFYTFDHIAQIIDGWHHNKNVGSDKVLDLAAGPLVPAALRDVAGAYDQPDTLGKVQATFTGERPAARVIKNPVDWLKSNVPGLRQTLPKK